MRTSTLSATRNHVIPKRLHRIWFDEPVAGCPFNRFWERFKELHPRWECKTWNDSAEVRALISEPAILKLWDEFIRTDPYGRIPDIARYAILRAFGGVYVDTDVEPFRSFDPLLEDPRPFIGWECDRECSTAVLASPANHPAIQALLDGLPDRVRTSRGNAVIQTGPNYATSVWRTRTDVRRFPPRYFYPVHWKDMVDLHPPYPAESYCVHHWASGWKSAAEKTHVQDISLVGPKLTNAERDFYRCYLPEAQIVEKVSEVEQNYVVELERFVPVQDIRSSTRELRNTRGIAELITEDAYIWRKDRRRVPAIERIIKSPKLSILVAFRDDSPKKERTLLWDFVRERFRRELPAAEIVVGTSDATPFGKAAALNRAASEATGDVFLLTDADSWVEPGAVLQGVRLLAMGRAAWCKPWKTKCKLGPKGTAQVLELGTSWDGKLTREFRKDAESKANPFRAAPPLLITRELFFDVGAIDPRFDKGWGGEDTALYLALRALHGEPVVLPGECVHLHHPRLGVSGRDRWEGQASPHANAPILREYQRARTPEQMRSLIERRSLVNA